METSPFPLTERRYPDIQRNTMCNDDVHTRQYLIIAFRYSTFECVYSREFTVWELLNICLYVKWAAERLL